MFQVSTGQRKPSQIDVVPMINIVFLLLIFFMLTTTATSQNNEIQLPEAETATLKNKSSLIITIDPEGRVELDSNVVAIDDLITLLKNNVDYQKNKLVEIQADQGIKFEIFSQVIEAAQQAGAVDFILAAEQIKSAEH